MDEPLSNLDAKLRVETRTQIASLQRQLATTTVYVTHDQVEAMTTGDRVAVLRDGVLQQCAAPHELYRDPANVFVGGFMGSPAMNIFTVPVINQTVSLGDWMIPIPREIADAATEVVVGIRPEHFDIDGLGVEIEVEVVEELGSDAFIYGRLVAGADNTTTADKPIVARADWRRPPERGTRIHLRPSPGHILFFANDPTGRRLR